MTARTRAERHCKRSRRHPDRRFSIELVIYLTATKMKIRDGFSGSRQIDISPLIIKEMEQHPVGKDLYVTHIGFYPKAAYHSRERPEGCDDHIFIYCINGQGWYEIKGEKKVITANQFFIIPPNVPHSYGTAENNPWTIYWIHFKGKKAVYLTKPLVLNGVNTIDIADNSRIESRLKLFEEIYASLELGFVVDNLLYAALCLYHFLGSLLFIPQFRQAGIRKDKEKGKSTGNMVELAVHYMYENMEKETSIANLVALSGYSTSQFNNIFKQKTGMSPKQYYLQLKIREACNYLSLTDMHINQLCYKIGINDPAYFSRIFSEIMGCSPTEYRTRLKG
jgi:AraC-like DNA-binding protein/quercetin dioxygenase-like cupin family protein